jgi:hypothetical protein
VHITSNDLARFWSHVTKTKDCWEYRTTKRYGEFFCDRSSIMAHRFSWEIHVGEIPSNLEVLHSCDNTRCVNPKHLFLGTQKDNVQDMLQKGRGNRGGRYRFSPKQASVIKERYMKGESTMCSLAYEYGTTRDLVRKIIHDNYYNSSVPYRGITRNSSNLGKYCQVCGLPLIMGEGCMSCPNCGFSKCG